MYILICNQILQYFIQINNYYAGYEFAKRNSFKFNQQIKQAADSELQQFYYNSALIYAMSGLYEKALTQIR